MENEHDSADESDIGARRSAVTSREKTDLEPLVARHGYEREEG